VEKEIIRIGKVSSIDYAKGLVRVAYHDKDNSVTQPLPMLSDKYLMPSVGDQIIVLHLSNGTEAGLVLGRYWNDKNAPKESGAGLFRMDLDRDGAAFLKCIGGTVTLKGGAIVVNGSVTINGSLTVSGDISATGDIVAGGVSLQNHTHTDSLGGATSPPA
jgi:phage baseplate assembly protein gpV